MANKKAGRPTKYTKAIQKKADDYAAGDYQKAGDVVPSRAGMACYLGVARQTLRNWSEEHPAFLATLTRVETAQERLTLNGGLMGEFNPQIAKLLLANHGYGEKIQQDNISSDGSMTPPTQIRIIPGDDS